MSLAFMIRWVLWQIVELNEIPSNILTRVEVKWVRKFQKILAILIKSNG